MSNINPMERFVSRFGDNSKLFNETIDRLDLHNQDDADAFLQAAHEMQMMNWTAGVATNRRHSLLKKIMTEIR